MKTCQILLALMTAILVRQAEASNITIDMLTKLEEGKEYSINCRVYEVALLEFLTINITRGGDVIDSKSYEAPYFVNTTTVNHLYTFNASLSDNHMNFSCEAILQVESNTFTSKSPEISVTTYARSRDDVEIKALSSEEFVPFGMTVWINCSTPFPNETVYESRLKKKILQRGPNWLAVQVIVNDWENSTLYCMFDTGIKLLAEPTTVMAYAEPSNVTIDMQTKLEEGNEYLINCTVYDIAPLEFLILKITRGGDVIDSKSYEGPHVVNRTTVSHLYPFHANRSDNHMNFSCEAVLQLGSKTFTSKSRELNVMTYALPEAPVITVPKWIENGSSFTVECLVANGFPLQHINLSVQTEETIHNAHSVQTSEGAIKSTFLLNATYSHLGSKDVYCKASLFSWLKETRTNVTVYELPTVSFELSSNLVELEESVTATCDITNKHQGAYGLFISVDGKEELRVQDSMVTHAVTASRRIPNLPITCTAFIIGNSSISRPETQTLEVHYPPEFTESLCPSTSRLVEGKTTFSCQADGNPKPTVVCSADGRDIIGTVAVTRDMSGNYTCHTTNRKGNATKDVQVIVEYAPETPTVTISSNATIRTGEPLNITCKSDGLPPPTYSWRIPDNAEVAYSPDKSLIIIPTAEWTHNGSYTCVATNAHGNLDTKQEVSVLPDEVNVGLIVGIAVGIVTLIAIISSVWYYLWKNGRTGFYELLRPSHRQCYQNGNIPSEAPVNHTTIV